jgi:hypothetical protein
MRIPIASNIPYCAHSTWDVAHADNTPPGVQAKTMPCEGKDVGSQRNRCVCPKLQAIGVNVASTGTIVVGESAYFTDANIRILTERRIAQGWPG